MYSWERTRRGRIFGGDLKVKDFFSKGMYFLSGSNHLFERKVVLEGNLFKGDVLLEGNEF